MLNKQRAEAERLQQQELDRVAAEEANVRTDHKKPVAATKDKVWFGGYILLLICFAVLHYIVALRFFGFSANITALLQRLAKGAVLMVFILGLAKVCEIYVIGRIEDPVSRYNLNRIQRLIVGLILTFVAISLLFVNWYTAVVSVGLISLILGFALQKPITSLIGWIYLMVRAPYSVGDRIKIGDATGDVIEVGYFDTTLWEFGGKYLSTDHPTGRIIRFPNSEVLESAIYNYTWPLFPYVWNEIRFNIAYNSDLEFVAATMQAAAEQEVGNLMMERVRVYRELLSKTPVDELEVKEHPAVLFRVSDNTWLVAIVRYLVNPKEAGRVKTRLIKKLLSDLNAAPDRVLFPKGDAR